MAEAQLQQFLKKIEQLNAFVALSEAQPEVRQALQDCSNHHDVVQLAAQFGFEIGRRWGDSSPKQPRPTDQPNLLRGDCPTSGQERTDVLASGQHWRLERIHSCQASSPAEGWYDQEDSEWVLVLQGTQHPPVPWRAPLRRRCAVDRTAPPASGYGNRSGSWDGVAGSVLVGGRLRCD